MERVSCEIPVPVFADTQSGLAEFLDCLRYVWEILDPELVKIIEGKLQRITYAAEAVFVDPEKKAVAAAWNLGGGCSELRVWAEGVSGSVRHCRNTIAHELRHAWQFAVGWTSNTEMIRLALRCLAEADATQFAEKAVGSESNFAALSKAGLPTDDDFDRLVDYWPELTVDERLDVLQLAAGLAMDRLASLKFAG